jgi:hypothetical protein
MSGSDAEEILRDVSRNRGAVADMDAGFTGLGLRGVVIEPLSDDVCETYDLPPLFKVGSGGSTDDGKSMEFAERLIRSMRKFQPSSPETDSAAALDQGLEDFLLKMLGETAARTTVSETDGVLPIAPPETDVRCTIELCRFNPAFWNRPEVIRRNNCYNYATNRRTDTFAQPGRGAGQMYGSLTCAEVMRAALADGCHRRFDCFPDGEKPRWLMALVVAPGRDYHWYRFHSERFWGHKPGGTAARNTDNSGRVIANPEVCDRGMYTDFCGYLYSCKTQQNRIR